MVEQSGAAPDTDPFNIIYFRSNMKLVAFFYVTVDIDERRKDRAEAALDRLDALRVGRLDICRPDRPGRGHAVTVRTAFAAVAVDLYLVALKKNIHRYLSAKTALFA